MQAGAKLRCSLWVPMHPQKFENPLLGTNFHHGFRSNFHTYKRNAPPLLCSSFAIALHHTPAPPSSAHTFPRRPQQRLPLLHFQDPMMEEPSGRPMASWQQAGGARPRGGGVGGALDGGACVRREVSREERIDAASLARKGEPIGPNLWIIFCLVLG